MTNLLKVSNEKLMTSWPFTSRDMLKEIHVRKQFKPCKQDHEIRAVAQLFALCKRQVHQLKFRSDP